MTQKTAIEWTDRTGNPIRCRHKVTKKVGWPCVKVSPGCAHCFSEAINNRFGTRLPFTRRSMEDLDIFLDERVLKALLKLRKPQRIFICDMTDMFGDWVEDEILDRIFCTMAMCRHLTFQVLTKRPERMAAYLEQVVDERDMQRWANHACGLAESPCAESIFEELDWPLPNVWLGTSVENREWALERPRHLLRCDAAVRFLSVEPLLGPVDLRALLDGIHWVIVGGESGPGARPMHPKWARSIRDQCNAAWVPFFFKQWGEWMPFDGPSDLRARGVRDDAHVALLKEDGRLVRPYSMEDAPGWQVARVGKKAAGRTLDGHVWSEFPEVAVG